MGTQRWLNIVVDGNVAMKPYWQDIVSSYLERIVRYFTSTIEEEEAYLGLVLYNANSELVDAGYDMQFINWTKDANKYVQTLSSLSFNGNDVNQSAMAEGLAEALVMYPKPSDTMTIREYYNAERHCILVVPGDPIPRKMMLCAPMIRRGQVVGQRLQACQADFLDVAQMFAPLAVSLSVISLNSLPIFGAIFNLGNNGLTLANAPISSYSTGQLTVLLSRNFQKAHDALQENRTQIFPSIKSLKSIDIAPASSLSRVFTTSLQEAKASSSTCDVSFGERTIEASRTESISTNSKLLLFQEPVFPNTTHEENVELALSHAQVNVFEDIIAELSAQEDVLTSNKKRKTFISLGEENVNDILEPNQLHFNDLNNFLGQDLWQDVSNNNNTSKDISHGTSKNQTSNVELVPSSNIDTTFSPQASASSCNSTFSHAMGNSLLQFQPYSSPSQYPLLLDSNNQSPREQMGQYFSGYQCNKNYNTSFGLLSTPAIRASSSVPPMSNMTPRCNSTELLSEPSLNDFQNYALRWEGSLYGKVKPNHSFVVKAKAFMKATTRLTLTSGWISMLEITNFVPQKAIHHTKTIHPPVEYVFFLVSPSNNDDLYEYLKSKSLCAKIDMPDHPITLSPAESDQLFIGTIFPRDTVFIEPI